MGAYLIGERRLEFSARAYGALAQALGDWATAVVGLAAVPLPAVVTVPTLPEAGRWVQLHMPDDVLSAPARISTRQGLEALAGLDRAPPPDRPPVPGRRGGAGAPGAARRLQFRAVGPDGRSAQRPAPHRGTQTRDPFGRERAELLARMRPERWPGILLGALARGQLTAVRPRGLSGGTVSAWTEPGLVLATMTRAWRDPRLSAALLDHALGRLAVTHGVVLHPFRVPDALLRPAALAVLFLWLTPDPAAVRDPGALLRQAWLARLWRALRRPWRGARDAALVAGAQAATIGLLRRLARRMVVAEVELGFLDQWLILTTLERLERLPQVGDPGVLGLTAGLGLLRARAFQDLALRLAALGPAAVPGAVAGWPVADLPPFLVGSPFDPGPAGQSDPLGARAAAPGAGLAAPVLDDPDAANAGMPQG